MNGIFFIDKPSGMTSREVVDTIIRKTETRKVGHTGTLDPLATGVLIVCVGKATKLVDLLTCEDKEYEARVCLGMETDTLDKEGTILYEESVHLTESQIDEALSSLIGSYQQEVPKYSAIRVNGKKLYEYARNQEEVFLPTREVTIYQLKRISPVMEEQGKVYFSIRTKVSKGTYIRSLIRDIARKLHTYGNMEELRRIQQGTFAIENCIPLEDLHLSDLHPISSVLTNFYTVTCSDELKKEVLNGKILENIYHQDKVVFKDSDGLVLAVYQIYEKDRLMMKPQIMLGGVE